MTEHIRDVASYHQRMSEKYYHVARHPWSSVAPDPPEPTFEEALQRETRRVQLMQVSQSAILASLFALQSATDLAYRVYDKATAAAEMLFSPR
jgi:hypothetical protein